jgi:hypothetical protein
MLYKKPEPADDTSGHPIKDCTERLISHAHAQTNAGLPLSNTFSEYRADILVR